MEVRRGLVVLLTVGVVCGCGSDRAAMSNVATAIPTQSTAVTRSAAANPCAASPACMTITVAITDDRDVSGTEAQARDGCALARSIETTHQPVLDLPVPHHVGGHDVLLVAGIMPFKGPGSFSHGVVLLTDDQDIVVDGTAYVQLVTGEPEGAIHAVVRADGSGTLIFTAFRARAAPTRSISGSMAWACTGAP